MVLNGDKSKANDSRSYLSFTKKNFIKFFFNTKNETISKLISFEGITTYYDDNQWSKNIWNWNISASITKVWNKIKANIISKKTSIRSE